MAEILVRNEDTDQYRSSSAACIMRASLRDHGRWRPIADHLTAKYTFARICVLSCALAVADCVPQAILINIYFNRLNGHANGKAFYFSLENAPDKCNAQYYKNRLYIVSVSV